MGRTPLTKTLISLAAGATLAGALAACGTDSVPKNADLVAGKQAFVKSCGSCHTLSRAGTKGTRRTEPRRGVPPLAARRAGPRHDARRRHRADRPSGAAAQDQPGLHAREARRGQARPRRRRVRRERRLAARARTRAGSAPPSPLRAPASRSRRRTASSRCRPIRTASSPTSRRSRPHPPARSTIESKNVSVHAARHRDRRQRRQGGRQDRLRRRRVDDLRRRSSPASTPTTARCQATAPAAWKASSPSSRSAAASRRRPRGRLPRARIPGGTALRDDRLDDGRDQRDGRRRPRGRAAGTRTPPPRTPRAGGLRAHAGGRSA